MINLKVRRQKFGIGPMVFLLLFGASFVGAGVFAIQSNKIDPSWTRVTGEIVDSSSRTSDGSTTYSPVVKYEVSGQSYRVASNMGSSSYPKIGGTREIAYDPSRPNESKVVEGTGSILWLYLFPIIGTACVVIGLYAFIRSTKRSGNINRLMQSGQKLQGILVDIQSGSSNRKGGYKIVVSATDLSGTVQNFVSDQLTGIGGLAMADFRSNPIQIDVYLDPANPNNYYVDVADIPNITSERIADLIKTAVQNKQEATTPTNEPKPPKPPVDPTFPPA